MNRARCIQIARAAMARRKAHAAREKGYTFHHGLRTAGIALRLRGQVSQTMEVSEKLLFLGGLFHDVGKGREPHNHSGADAVVGLLGEELTGEEIEAVGRIIREHNQRKNSRRCWVASKIVQDADLLDHFGAHGVWLCLHYSANRDRTDAQTLKYYNSTDHQAYQAKSRKNLNFEISRLSFDRRISLERQYMDRLAVEADGGL